MKLCAHSTSRRRTGSVLIIVMWVSFGLVSLALYFAQSMDFELRASDNRGAGLEAEQTVQGGARYISYILKTLGTNGQFPDLLSYQREGVPVGLGKFWIIGRADRQVNPSEPFFALIDESSKLNLNTATSNMLQSLPRMTPELAAAIIDWRDSDNTVSPGGAESETYQRLQPPYNCKNAPFETVDELRLVYGADLETLFGEDVNMNGILDPNENDGMKLPPMDNSDSHLDPGLLEYVTIYSRQPNSNRTNVNDVMQLTSLLQQQFNTTRANEILAQLTRGQTPNRGGGGRGGNGNNASNYKSILEFYVKSGMTADEFSQVSSLLTTTNSAYINGLINVNTASVEVLACVPGIGTNNAISMASYRQSSPDKLNSIAWVAEVLDQASANQAGPFITTECYQFTADIAGVGHNGRGYNRTKFVFDTSEGTPKILYRQDLTRLGWALGNITQLKLQTQLAKETR